MIKSNVNFSCLSLLLLLSISAEAQNYAVAKVKWLSFEQVDHLQKTEKQPKKVLVDLYTDNCGWCRKMDLSTFQNEFIAHYINENFYPVRFNAQTKKDVQFANQLFKPDKSGYHELAISLSLNDLGFPTLVFLDEENQILQPIPGYQSVDELEPIMYYFAKGLYNTTLWTDFIRQFKTTNSRPKIDPIQQNQSNGVVIKKQ